MVSDEALDSSKKEEQASPWNQHKKAGRVIQQEAISSKDIT